MESEVKCVRNTKGDEALFFIACVIRARPLCTLNPVFQIFKSILRSLGLMSFV